VTDRVRRYLAFAAPLVALPLVFTPSAHADSTGGQPYPVVNTQYIYDQDRYMSENYRNRISGGDGDPRTGTGNLPPLLNGWQEFYAHWKEQMTSPAVMGSWSPYLFVRDHYFKTTGVPFDSDVREVTIPGASCPGERVLLASHPDGTPGLNTNNGSAYDDTSGVVMGIGELQALLRWYAANGTWPARTLKVGLFDAEETGLNGSYYYAGNLLPAGPQGKYVLVANMDQNGIEYPAFHLGTAHYFTNNPGGYNGPWRTNINASPLTKNDIYPDFKPIAANMTAIKQFRADLADSVSLAFARLGERHGFKVPLENPLEGGATTPAYQPGDVAKYSPVQDDTLGRTDQVPFVEKGIPGFGVLGAYDSNDKESPYPNRVPLKPPINQYAGYDTPRDNIQHLNLMTSGTTGGSGGSAELKAALELPATWTTYLVTRKAYGGVAVRPRGPVAYFETTPVQPTKTDATITFDATGSVDTASRGLSYYWDFGDGTTARGAAVKHTYTKPIYADVRLVVRDVKGHTFGYRQAVPVLGTKAPAPTTASCGVLSAAETHAVLASQPPLPGLVSRRSLPTTGLPLVLPVTGLGALAFALALRRRTRRQVRQPAHN
jgi:hypothetical protein